MLMMLIRTRHTKQHRSTKKGNSSSSGICSWTCSSHGPSCSMPTHSSSQLVFPRLNGFSTIPTTYHCHHPPPPALCRQRLQFKYTAGSYLGGVDSYLVRSLELPEDLIIVAANCIQVAVVHILCAYIPDLPSSTTNRLSSSLSYGLILLIRRVGSCFALDAVPRAKSVPLPVRLPRSYLCI